MLDELAKIVVYIIFVFVAFFIFIEGTLMLAEIYYGSH